MKDFLVIDTDFLQVYVKSIFVILMWLCCIAKYFVPSFYLEINIMNKVYHCYQNYAVD